MSHWQRENNFLFFMFPWCSFCHSVFVCMSSDSAAFLSRHPCSCRILVLLNLTYYLVCLYVTFRLNGDIENMICKMLFWAVTNMPNEAVEWLRSWLVAEETWSFCSDVSEQHSSKKSFHHMQTVIYTTWNVPYIHVGKWEEGGETQSLTAALVRLVSVAVHKAGGCSAELGGLCWGGANCALI